MILYLQKTVSENTKIRTKITRVVHKLYTLSDNPKVGMKNVECSRFPRKLLVAKPNHQYLHWNL